MCRNFNNPSAWFCYFYAGKSTAGKTNLTVGGECEACAKLTDTIEVLPNFMTDEANN